MQIDFAGSAGPHPENFNAPRAVSIAATLSVLRCLIVHNWRRLVLKHPMLPAGLYPDDPLQAMYADEAMGAVEDMLHQLVTTFGLEGDELKAAREKLADGWLKVFVLGLGDILERGGNEYFADNRLTVADLKVYVQVRSLRSGTLDHVPTDLVDNLAPALVAHEERVHNDAVVTAYYESRQ